MGEVTDSQEGSLGGEGPAPKGPRLPRQVWSSAASSSRKTSMALASPSAVTGLSWYSPFGQVRRGCGHPWVGGLLLS